MEWARSGRHLGGLENDPSVSARLTPEQIQRTMSPAGYLGDCTRLAGQRARLTAALMHVHGSTLGS